MNIASNIGGYARPPFYVSNGSHVYVYMRERERESMYVCILAARVCAGSAHESVCSDARDHDATRRASERLDRRYTSVSTMDGQMKINNREVDRHNKIGRQA
eukprot:GHVU01206101.1.p1 GENE.GHVU01206101.1~~GHVU01206101.1.p1  ORF type:complete len:102 (+),score=2.38 GHVU01206101.1:127-432(+)